MIFKRKKKEKNLSEAYLRSQVSKSEYAEALKRKAKYSNKEFVEMKYREFHGKAPDLERPTLFTEKIQWVKLFYNNPLYARCADKYTVRGFVEEKGLGNILNKLIGVYESADDIDLDSLPDRFVIKASHGCAWNLICRDKSEFAKTWDDYKKLLNQWLRQDYSVYGRELHYTYMRPRLICEQFLENKDGSEIRDYKFFCFHGEPKLIQVDYDRYSHHTRNYYDPQWNLTDIRWVMRESNPSANDKPENLEQMLEVAKRLSSDFFHVRVDLYNVDGTIYLGELTFTDGCGYLKLLPEGTDEMMGSWIDLPLDDMFVSR